jgi:hypothetical protein
MKFNIGDLITWPNVPNERWEILKLYFVGNKCLECADIREINKKTLLKVWPLTIGAGNATSCYIVHSISDENLHSHPHTTMFK